MRGVARQKEGNTMKAKTKRTFRQILHDIMEEETLAITMAYAGSRGDFETARELQKRIQKN